MPENPNTTSDPRIRFLIALGRALHSYGVPAHRLEDALGNAAKMLGIRGEFFSGPTSLISSFGPPGQQHTALSRVQPGQLQLDKLVQLDEVVESLYRGDIQIDEAEANLESIDQAPLRYGPLMTILAFGLASGTAARFFGGGGAEMLVSLGLGLVTGVLAVLSGRWLSLERIFEFLVAMVATFLAVAAGKYLIPVHAGSSVLASLIILLPGLTLTLALNELATGHLVSGTARLTGAMMTFLKIGLGVGIGQRLAFLLPGGAVGNPDPAILPEWTLWAALALTPWALTVLFRARWKESPWIFLGSVIAFWGARLGVELLGSGLGAVIGALVTGLAANLYARGKRRPAVVLVVPSLILLVPGSIGYRSLSLLMAEDVTSGIGNAFEALLVGVSLVAGLLLANVLLPSRKAL